MSGEEEEEGGADVPSSLRPKRWRTQRRAKQPETLHNTADGHTEGNLDF